MSDTDLSEDDIANDPELAEFAEMERKLPFKERMRRESAVHFSGRNTTDIRHRLDHHRELTAARAKLARLEGPEGPAPWENQEGVLDTRTEEQKPPGPDYVPIGGAGNGA